MANEKSAVDSFLEGNSEPRDIFAEKEVAPEAEVEGKEEKSVPFHRDPKVQKYIEKQVEKALKDHKPAESQFKQEVKDLTLPDSFVKLVGNDTAEKQQVLKDLDGYFKTLKGEARQEFLDDLKEQEKAKKEADTKASEELDTYFEEIEGSYGVDLSSDSASAKQLRSQFIDYVRKIAPKNAEGEVTGFPDLISAYDEFQSRQARPTASRAKQLASRGLSRSGDTNGAAPTGKSWRDVDRFFDSLKK